jgi:uncharacterized delta-60 repeat protein
LDKKNFKPRMSLILDSSFGSGGVTIGPNKREILALFVQTDGKIVAPGFDFSASFTNVPRLVRYSADGKTSEIFSTAGLPADFAVSDVVVGPDGSIIVVGNSNTLQTFVVARYTSSGQLDAKFSGGVVQQPANAISQSVTLQADGKIVVTGSNNTFSNVITVRYTTTGTIDTTFSGTFPGIGVEVLVQPDGKILVCDENSVATPNFQVIRYNRNGTPDMTFGIAGIATGPSGSSASLALRRDGVIVLGGSSSHLLPPSVFRVALFSSIGTLISFADGQPGILDDIVIAGDQRAVAIGVTGISPNFSFQLQRFNTNGTAGDFFVGPRGTGAAIAMQSDGKMLAGGETDVKDPIPNTFEIARYTTSPLPPQRLTATVITRPSTASQLIQGNEIIRGTAQNPSNVYILIDGVVVGGTTTTAGTDAWVFSTILLPGIHIIQAVSLYQSGNVNILSPAISIFVASLPFPRFSLCCKSSRRNHHHHHC